MVKETEVIPVLLGNPEKIKFNLEIEGIMDGYEVIDPQHYPQFEEMVAALVERRKGKMSEEDARKVLVEDVNYFGVMLVYLAWLMEWCQVRFTQLLQQFAQLFKSSNSSKCYSYFRCLPHGSWYGTLPIW